MSVPGRSEPLADPRELVEALAFAHRVAVLAETDPAAPLVVATRAALEVADARREARRACRRAGLQVHGGDGAWWARWADQWVPAEEIAARRAAPGPTATNPTPGLNREVSREGGAEDGPMDHAICDDGACRT